MRRDWQLARVEVWTGLDDPTAPGRADPGLHRTLVVPSALDPDADPIPPRSSLPNWACCAVWAWPGRAGCGCGCPPARRPRERGPAGRPAAAVRGPARRQRPGAGGRRAAAGRAAVQHGRRPGLAEVARRLAIVLRNRSLDEALQATLADLRRANADLQASRRRLVTTADAERKRIERDLHDGAQHLVALAVGIRLVRDSLAACASPADIELLDELDRGVRESIGSLAPWRSIYPPLLRDSGLEEALRAAAKRSALPVTVSASNLGRHPEQVEAAVYFCCLEALTNAGKHARVDRDDHAAGRAGRAAVRGRRLRSRPDPATTPAGAGLSNMADRIGALGGEVAWRAAPGTERSSSAAPGALRRARPGRAARRSGGGLGVRPRRRRSGRPRRAVRTLARAAALGLLFGLVGGIVLGTVAVADRTVTAYERLAAATGLADAQVLLPAARDGLRPGPEHARGDRELDTGRLDRPDQHPGGPVRLAQRRPRPPAGLAEPVVVAGLPATTRQDEILVSEPCRGPGPTRRRRGDPAPAARPGDRPGSPRGSGNPTAGFARVTVVGVARAPAWADPVTDLIVTPALRPQTRRRRVGPRRVLRLASTAPAARDAFAAALADAYAADPDTCSPGRPAAPAARVPHLRRRPDRARRPGRPPRRAGRVRRRRGAGRAAGRGPGAAAPTRAVATSSASSARWG